MATGKQAKSFKRFGYKHLAKKIHKRRTTKEGRAEEKVRLAKRQEKLEAAARSSLKEKGPTGFRKQEDELRELHLLDPPQVEPVIPWLLNGELALELEQDIGMDDDMAADGTADDDDDIDIIDDFGDIDDIESEGEGEDGEGEEGEEAESVDEADEEKADTEAAKQAQRITKAFALLVEAAGKLQASVDSVVAGNRSKEMLERLGSMRSRVKECQEQLLSEWVDVRFVRQKFRGRTAGKEVRNFDVGRQQGVDVLQQLAAHISAVMAVPTPTSVAMVCNWRFLACLEVVAMACYRYPGEKEFGVWLGSFEEVATGTLSLLVSPTTLPFQLHVSALLMAVAQKTGQYTPVGPYLTRTLLGAQDLFRIPGQVDVPESDSDEIVTGKEKGKKKKKWRKGKKKAAQAATQGQGKEKASIPLDCLVAAPTKLSKELWYRQAVVQEQLQRMAQLISSFSNSIAFPEIAHPILTVLRQSVPLIKHDLPARFAKDVAGKAADHSAKIFQARKNCKFDPSDTEKVQMWENEAKQKYLLKIKCTQVRDLSAPTSS